MSKEVEELANEAIQASLDKRWTDAIKLNKEIIDFDSENIQALNRLGKAYIESGKFEEAKKTLKAVLKLDPINQTAKKNLEFAQNSKRIIGNSPLPDAKSFIKEPGTTKEYNFILQTKGITSKKFYVGEPLNITTEKNKVLLVKITGEVLGSFDPEMTEKITSCFKKGGTLAASYISGEDKEVKIMLKSSIPMFKSEKQEVKPYIKREIEETEEEQVPQELELV